jgi:pyruvate-formate lyase-activating enzyme
MFGENESDRTLRQSHEQTFADWLAFDLKQQKQDLDLYLSAFQVEKRTILATWIRLAPYRNLTPTTVQEPERRLYLTDIEAILELLSSENDVEPLDPDE